MIVTDARDVYDKLSTEKGGLPQQKALTLEIDTIRAWLVNSGALIRWTADENMIMSGLTKDHNESRQQLARVLQNGEWSVQRHATLVREKSASQSKRTRRTKPVQTSTCPCSEEFHDESYIVETESERVVEQIIDVPIPQIVEDIVELGQLVDVPVPQIELVLSVVLILSFFLCCGMERCAFFLSSLRLI